VIVLDKSNLAIFILIALAVAFPFVSAGAIMLNQRVLSNAGNLTSFNIGVYELDMSSFVTNINWGNMELGQTVSRLVYLHNDGNTNIMATMEWLNWNPSNLTSYFSLSWNASGQVIVPQGWLLAEFSLHSFPDMILFFRNFSFDIVITGNEV
jgi:hypothetical protein